MANDDDMVTQWIRSSDNSTHPDSFWRIDYTNHDFGIGADYYGHQTSNSWMIKYFARLRELCTELLGLEPHSPLCQTAGMVEHELLINNGAYGAHSSSTYVALLVAGDMHKNPIPIDVIYSHIDKTYNEEEAARLKRYVWRTYYEYLSAKGIRRANVRSAAAALIERCGGGPEALKILNLIEVLGAPSAKRLAAIALSLEKLLGYTALRANFDCDGVKVRWSGPWTIVELEGVSE